VAVQYTEIAERLKAIRELCDVTAEDVAKHLGVSLDDYLSYESGNIDIPVSVLYEVCSFLNISMTELLTGDKDKLHIYSVVRDGKGIDVERTKGYKYHSLASGFARRKVEPLLVTLEPEDKDKPLMLNSHMGQEYHYCIDGSFILYIDKYEVKVNKGDSVYFDSKYKHAMRAVGDKQVKILVVVI
jgi:transcriptional regulator, XRE family